MKVQQLMTSPAVTCGPESSIAAAARLMWKHDCGIVPVVDSHARVVAVITDRDVAMAVGASHESPDSLPVHKAMSSRLFTCFAEDTLDSAIHTMTEAHVRRLPVVTSGGTLRGMLSLNDIVQHAGEPGAPTCEAVVGVFKAVCAHRTVEVVR